MRWGGQPAHCSLMATQQAISKHRGKQFVGLRRREWCGAVGGEQGSRLACTGLNREGELQVSERFRRIARHVGIGEGDGPVAPNFARRTTFALARGNLAPDVSCREGLQLPQRRVLCEDTPNHPEQRGARKPGPSLRQVDDQLCFAKAANVEQTERGTEARKREEAGLRAWRRRQ
eukprot:1821881-Pleurochrysis_carterae.AAC.1